MELLTRNNFEGWMQKILERLDRQDELLLAMKAQGQQPPFLSEGIRLFDNQDLCMLLQISKRTLQRYRSEGQMVISAYDYFKKHGSGQLAVISSIAGTKGLGAAPSYSATKRYQNTYIEALDQLAQMEKLPIVFTDIRPGFVKTDLLKNDKYPMLMSPQYVARKIVKAIERKKRRTVIDWKYAVLVFFWKLIPSFVWRRLPIHN